jgi:GT2 family glycosyltransferase
VPVNQPKLTIGITTSNRPESLARAISSLTLLAGLTPEVLVFDDGSVPPVNVAPPGLDIRVLRDDTSPGYIVGRNRMMREALSSYVLLLDDDTRLVSADAVHRALAVMRDDPAVGAVAFAQAEADGTPWPAQMQPASVGTPSVVASYIGFAHLLRRDVFVALGGYREAFVFYGEEKEFCVRLLDAGYKTVFVPDALISHVPDPAGRDRRRYLRSVSRNDCLASLLSDPLLRALYVIPARVALYLRMRRHWGIADPGGLSWLLAEVSRTGFRLLRQGERKPVAWRTIRRWRSLRRRPEPYPCAS